MVKQEEIYKGGTLIIPLTNIKLDNKDYEFEENDEIIFAIKSNVYSKENVLTKTASCSLGEKSVEVVFTAEETNEKLEVGESYILQADLINSKGRFPMILSKLYVVGQAIVGD